MKKFHCGFLVNYKDSLLSCESDKQGGTKTNEKYLQKKIDNIQVISKYVLT